ncbi:MAG TPA: hypothetical protein VMH80_14375 [Bryobacteraceae bacterium]|nr:hypothetical protein [Bryobacteraceae bacterium]
MNFAKKLLMGLGAFALGVSLMNLVAPKVVQAAVAVLFKNIDEQARAPYQAYLHAVVGPGSSCGTNFCDFAFPVVPANKRLAVTNVSVRIVPDSTANIEDVKLYVLDSSFTFLSQYTLQFNPFLYPGDNLAVNTVRTYVDNEQVRWYLEAGQIPRLTFHTSGGNLDPFGEQRVMLVGYLVDLTQ